MRKLLLLGLLTASSLAFGQSTLHHGPDTVATQRWVREYLKGLVVEPPVVVDPPSGLDPCEAGPEIRSISSVTTTSLVVLFHGKNVFGLDFQILSGGTVVRSGQLEPKSNLLTISYARLEPGTYTLRLVGNTCAGADSKTFPIPQETGYEPGPPPVVLDPVGDRTLASWRYIGRTDTTYLDIELRRDGNRYLITDRAAFPLRAGYEYWYTINGTIVKSGVPLKDYPYLSISGVLDVKKHHFVRGLDTPARWSSSSPGNAWYKPDASYTWGPGSDVGGQSIILLEGGDEQTGIPWLSLVPTWYQGDHTMSWPYRAPEGKVPSGKLLGFNARVVGISNALRRSRGETHTTDDPTVPEHQRLGRVIGCVALGITTDAGTRDYYRSMADRFPLSGAAAYEMNEGAVWLPHGSWQVRTMMERLTERYLSKGHDYFLNADYGGYNYLTPPIWNRDFEGDPVWRYRVSADELRSRDKYFRAFGGSINSITVKHYGTDPDFQGPGICNQIFLFEQIKKAGYKAILFGWNFMEIFQHGYAPGFAWQNEIGNGTALSSSLAVQPYEEAVTMGFLANWYGDGLWIWDGQAPRNRDASTLGMTYEPKKTTLWNGATIRTDRDSFEGTFQPEPDAALDGYYAGAVTLTNQVAGTEGGERRYLPFSVDGKSYGTEPDGSDVLTALDQKRGLCQIRTQGNQATLLFLDPFASLTWRDFSVTISGKTFTGRVFGNRIHVANLNL
ncbi:hypothetical protein GCM10027275_50320 [Rhabdobacter roseus]|uniref:Uncharacterized protein n=1 Tax=Rhabdobacter roseus TaxID=1655419 RepID=A0A840TV29_9BACT|nr:hypothetical protein [Rhabdobacter roseus]MBB5287104.1 hypothetical protein [Rhabdobacter roseus]